VGDGQSVVYPEEGVDDELMMGGSSRLAAWTVGGHTTTTRKEGRKRCSLLKYHMHHKFAFWLLAHVFLATVHSCDYAPIHVYITSASLKIKKNGESIYHHIAGRRKPFPFSLVSIALLNRTY
jgi:hypothetical protein